MSYSDEPNVISEQTRPRKIYFVVGGLVLFFALLSSVVLYKPFREYQRHHTPVGPNQGSVHFVRFEGERYSIEFARSSEIDYHLALYIQPVRDRSAWRPEEFHALVRREEDDELQIMPWDPEHGYFGLSERRYHPMGDFRFEVELRRGEETVWSGRRWSYRLFSGHSH